MIKLIFLLKKKLAPQEGFGIVEIIVAMAIFVTIAATAVTTIIQSFNINRLGNEETKARFYAQEGLEAVRSLKNRGWSNMDIGSTTCGATVTRGITSSGSSWAFLGSSDAIEKYTRTITLANVCRDASGTIATPGTIYDPDIKKVTANLAWSFTGSRSDSVAFTTYVSHYDKAIRKGGMLVYSNLAGGANNDQIQYQILNSPGEWLAAQNIPDFGVPLDRPARQVNLYSSPTRNEKILITKHYANSSGNDQYIYVQVWNGQSWGDVILLSSWGGTTRPEVRDFDGDYLNNGDFLLVHEDNTNIPKYRIWNGTAWSGQGNTLNVGGNPDFIVVRNRAGTNEAMVAVRDAGDDTNTIYWNGSSWGGLVEHGGTSAGAAYETVDFVWSLNTPTTGALIYNEAADTYPNIRIWNGTSWSGAAENVNLGTNSIPRAMSIVSRPGANEFLACFKDSLNDINCLKSNFTPSWTTVTNGEITTSTDTSAQRSFALKYERQSGTPAVVVYSNTATSPNNPKYRVFNPTTNSFGAEQSLPALAAPLESANIFTHPDTDDMLVAMGGTLQRSYIVVWDGTSDSFYATGGYGLTTHGTLGSNDLDFWYDFSWDRL